MHNRHRRLPMQHANQEALWPLFSLQLIPLRLHRSIMYDRDDLHNDAMCYVLDAFEMVRVNIFHRIDETSHLSGETLSAKLLFNHRVHFRFGCFSNILRYLHKITSDLGCFEQQF